VESSLECGPEENRGALSFLTFCFLGRWLRNFGGEGGRKVIWQMGDDEVRLPPGAAFRVHRKKQLKG
jgi:hypothetical protein